MEQTRDRLKPIRVYVTPDERAAIETHAKACSLTVSAYLRTLGAGYEPKSTLDMQAVGDLIKVHADQGRLGGLLKLWLVEKPGQGASVYDVRTLLRKIEALQEQLKGIVKGLRMYQRHEPDAALQEFARRRHPSGFYDRAADCDASYDIGALARKEQTGAGGVWRHKHGPLGH